MAHPIVFRYLSYSTTLSEHADHCIRRCPAFGRAGTYLFSSVQLDDMVATWPWPTNVGAMVTIYTRGYKYLHTHIHIYNNQVRSGIGHPLKSIKFWFLVECMMKIWFLVKIWKPKVAKSSIFLLFYFLLLWFSTFLLFLNYFLFYICTFVLLYFCTFVFLFFCTFVLMSFCTLVHFLLF